MSQPLPAHPDLEHLRKQAKALLRDLRTRDAQAKLADALHLVARQYGFPSWAKLKAHVRSIVQSAGGSMASPRWTSTAPSMWAKTATR